MTKCDYDTSPRLPRRRLKPIDFGFVILGVLIVASFDNLAQVMGWPWWQVGLVASAVVLGAMFVRQMLTPRP